MKDCITPTFEIRTLDELRSFVAKHQQVPEDYEVAVGSLIFDHDDRVILKERGAEARDAQGELEGIGGGLDEHEEDLMASQRLWNQKRLSKFMRCTLQKFPQKNSADFKK